MFRGHSSLKRVFSLYLAQIFNLLLGWAITKLNVSYLSVEEFGQFNFFITVINSTFIFFTFGTLEASSRLLAILDARKTVQQILSVSLLFVLIIYGIFTGFIYITNPFIQSYFSINIFLLINLFFPISGVYLLYDFWQKVLRGKGQIYALAWFLVLPRILYLLLLFMLIYIDKYTLQFSTFFSLISIMLIFLFYLSFEQLDFQQFRQSAGRLLKEVKTFGFQMYWAELIHVVLYHIDKLFIGYYLDAEQLAYYSLAFTITLPLSLFSTSLSTSLYKKFSQSKKIDIKVLFLNFLWVFFSFILLVLIGPWIIENLFSAEYQESTKVLIPLALAFGISGQSKTFTYYLIARGEGKMIRNASVILLVISLIINIFLIPLYGIMGAAYARIITFLVDFLLILGIYNRHQKLHNG
jgi:O-antigen/teichoic acid export membrane protein